MAGAKTPGSWTTGMCGCLEDMPSCCCVCWCPCVVLGRTAEMVTGGTISRETACCRYCLLGPHYSKGFRTQLRLKYQLPEEPCGDCSMHSWCTGCALCQEYRELKNRGWDPVLPYGTPPNPPDMSR